MENYCITHDVGTSYDINFIGSGCVIVSCPPPDLPDNWDDGLAQPDDDEMLVMYLNSLELEADFTGEYYG